MVSYGKSGGTGEAPVLVLNTNAQRETGRKAQRDNIHIAQSVASIVKTCLGPKAMMKMLLDPMNGITCTADGHAILREIDMAHPTAKTLLELCRAQDEEVGDGTTSVVILAAEILAVTTQLLDKKFHPVAIINAYRRAVQASLPVVSALSRPVNVASNDDELLPLVRGSIGTKLATILDDGMDVFAKMAIKAVRIVARADASGSVRDIDTKRYVRIEKIPGGSLSECKLVDGVVLNKDILHPQMRRRIENPRIVLLDCPLEYRKGENATNLEVGKDGDWSAYLRQEEEQVAELCAKIVALRPDIVVSEKGVSDLAQHHLLKANVSVLRRLKKSDNNRLARACGATIVNNVDDLREADVGTQCGLFHVELISNDYFSFFDECSKPKACSILLRGQSKDVLSELERNLHDAMAVTRNLLLSPSLVPGGGSVDCRISEHLLALATDNSQPLSTVERHAFRALAKAFDVIPRILLQNAGADVTAQMVQLHKCNHQQQANEVWGVDGVGGTIVKMDPLDKRCVFEASAVKLQTIRAAVDAACLILRVDDILAGLNQKAEAGPAVQVEDMEATPEEP